MSELVQKQKNIVGFVWRVQVMIGNVRILGTMKKFPAGAMVIPLLLGCTVNTFFPEALKIGGFTTGLFKNGIPTLIGLYLFCSGATIDVKAAGETVYKGVFLTALKFFGGFGIGLLLNAIFGEAGFLGLLPLAVIGAVTNSNGVIYATLAGEYGDESDVGATAIMASIIPLIIGFIIGNLDHEWRETLSTAMALLPPFNGFCLGAGMSFFTIAGAGFSGILLGLLTVAVTGIFTFIIYSLIRRKADPMGAAIGTVAGVAATTPAAIADADPSFAPQVETASAQIAAATIVTAIVTPLLVAFLARWSRKFNEKHGLGNAKQQKTGVKAMMAETE